MDHARSARELHAPWRHGRLRSAVRLVGGRPGSFVACLIPTVVVLAVLFPYLWPPDNAPTSHFSDIHLQHGPNLQLLASELEASGELPLWNRQDFAGIPTVADPQAGVYNPIYRLMLLRPSLNSFGVMIVAYALAGAVGFVFYARLLGLSAAGAAAGAVAFTVAGKLLFHLVVPGHTVWASFMLVPWILHAIERTAGRPTVGRVVVLAAWMALLTVTLHPQILFYSGWVFMAVAVSALGRSERRMRAGSALGCGAILAVGLSAVHVFPFVALVHEFARAHPELYDVARWNAEHPEVQAHLSEIVFGSSVSWEAHYYLGGVCLLLSIFGLAAWPKDHPNRRHARFHGLLALVFLLYALGPDCGVQPWIDAIPGLAQFRIPARALIVVQLPVALLVALGVDAAMRAPADRWRTVAVGATAVSLGTLIWLEASVSAIAFWACALTGVALLHAGAHEGLGGPRASVAVTLVGAGGLLGGLILDTSAPISRGVQVEPAEEVGLLAPGVEPIPDLGKAVRVTELRRATAGPGIPALARRRLGLETTSGYNPMVPWRFLLYAGYASGYDPVSYNVGDTVPLFRGRTKLFDLLGVTHFLHPPGPSDATWRWQSSESPLPRAYFVPRPIVVWEGEGARWLQREIEALQRLERIDPRRSVLLHGPRARAALKAAGIEEGTTLEPFRAVPLTTRTANRITLSVETASPGILVLNEPFFDGWHAWDGDVSIPMMRANVLFRSLALDAGSHRVVMEYRPLSWRVGWWVSLLAVLIMAWLAWIAVSPRRGRRVARQAG